MPKFDGYSIPSVEVATQFYNPEYVIRCYQLQIPPYLSIKSSCSRLTPDDFSAMGRFKCIE